MDGDKKPETPEGSESPKPLKPILKVPQTQVNPDESPRVSRDSEKQTSDQTLKPILKIPENVEKDIQPVISTTDNKPKVAFDEKKEEIPEKVTFDDSKTEIVKDKVEDKKATPSPALQHSVSIDESDSGDESSDIDEEDMTIFDDLIPYVGEFGLYQKMLFFMMVPYAFFLAFVYYGQIFMTLVPNDYWCKVPELMNLTMEERVNMSIPKDASGKPMHCVRYDVDWNTTNVKPPDAELKTIPCDKGYEYDFTSVPFWTIASELDWVCDQDNLPTVAQSVFFCGSIVGGIMWGYVADKYGRVPALVGTCGIGFAAGLGTAFSTTFASFAVTRFLVGIAFDNCFTIMYILVLEYVGGSWRTFVGNMSMALFYTTGTVILPWMILSLMNWRHYALVMSVPLVLGLVTPWIVPESAMWLVTKGRVEESLKAIEKFERVNKKRVPLNILDKFKQTMKFALKERKASGDKSYTVVDLFKTPRLRMITIALVAIWMIVALVFDGHVRNVGSLGMDVFLTFTLAGATELPADVFLIFMLDRWGRRWLSFGTLILCGIFTIAAAFIPPGVGAMVLALLGRLSISVTYNIGMQYATELLPTLVRAQGVAFIHIMGYVAAIFSPIVVYLNTVFVGLPLIILGVLSFVGAFITLTLPETMDQDLPQSMEDGENFGKDQKFWYFPCGKAPPSEDVIARSMANVRNSLYIRPSIMTLRPGPKPQPSLYARASIFASIAETTLPKEKT